MLNDLQHRTAVKKFRIPVYLSGCHINSSIDCFSIIYAGYGKLFAGSLYICLFFGILFCCICSVWEQQIWPAHHCKEQAKYSPAQKGILEFAFYPCFLLISLAAYSVYAALICRLAAEISNGWLISSVKLMTSRQSYEIRNWTAKKNPGCDVYI